jgi:hypothetical protein
MGDGTAEAVARAGGEDAPRGGRTRNLTRIIVGAVVVLVVGLLVCDFAYGPMSWGRDGDLELTIEVDPGTMPFDGAISCNYTLTNTGDTDLRVLLPSRPWISIYETNDTSVRWVGPVTGRGHFTDDDLVTIRAGMSRSWELDISSQRWGLSANETYRVVGFLTTEGPDGVTLPHWQGELTSNEVTFDVAG